ncbi:MAG TPA: flagellar basal-body rod protein FlgG [Phycisphaerales bacterium]|nr:flagellar basal-body rod protein FlgG [Phycisphaerales bacterium]
MLKAFSTAATGMSAQELMINVTANNLANINTNGFKRSQVDFQDLLYVHLRQAGAEMFSGQASPGGMEVGSGVRAASTVKVFSPGELVNTTRPLDLAITGEGFFQISMPDGTTRYTRDGAFQKGPNGELMTATGYLLDPPITIPTDAVAVTIGKDGSVNVTDPSGTQSVVGSIQLANFPNPSGLSSEGDNLLAQTEASGTAVTGIPGNNGLGLIQGGFLEKSNVQMVTELVNLITAQRAYEVSSRAIRAGDQMLQTAIQTGSY